MDRSCGILLWSFQHHVTDGLLSQLNALQGTQSSRTAIGGKRKQLRCSQGCHQPWRQCRAHKASRAWARARSRVLLPPLRPPRVPLGLNLRRRRPWARQGRERSHLEAGQRTR
ncbi:hypothetical protein GQ55_5G036000 [Panicum hallii var. hallii]|uniref:Uncharacterized protein n=1 Tax=Panicum hallii var. hallii TaxID=1504633 RepID=A0A2T7DC98_9POAL|nr:hypothetical protein GQ55_5G036000 [Panicum hallii var. hallii]